MSIFICTHCDNLRNSDDGCEEAHDGRFGLICMECAEEREAEQEELQQDKENPQ